VMAVWQNKYRFNEAAESKAFSVLGGMFR